VEDAPYLTGIEKPGDLTKHQVDNEKFPKIAPIVPYKGDIFVHRSHERCFNNEDLISESVLMRLCGR